MQFHAEPSKPHQTFLKEGEGGGMGMNRGKGELRNFVELKEEDESCRHTLKNSGFKLFAQKNSNITLFCERNLKHIYCKYLQGE